MTRNMNDFKFIFGAHHSRTRTKHLRYLTVFSQAAVPRTRHLGIATTITTTTGT